MKTTPLNSISKVSFKPSKLYLLVSGLLGLASFGLQAAEVEREFLLNTEISHQSNPRMDATDRRSVTIYRIAPEFNMNVATELNRFYLKSLLSVYRNSNEEALPDREDPTVTAGWERTLASGLFGLEAFYDERVALTDELNTLGTATGNRVENVLKTKRIAAKYDHDFNSRFSLKNQLSFTDNDYSETTSSLTDYKVSDVSSRLVYHNSETLSTYGQLGFLYYDPDDADSNGKLSRARLGVIVNPLDGLDIDANAGFYRATGFNSSSGMEAEVTGTYVRERMSYNFSASRLITARGVAEFQKTSAYLLGAKYLISELRAVGAEYTNGYNKTENSNNIRTQAIGAYYEHGFNQDWRLRAAARLMELDNGVARSGNEIGVTLIYGPLGF